MAFSHQRIPRVWRALAGIFAANTAVCTLWVMWWHLGWTDTWLAAIADAWLFLTWTLLPCWVVAGLIVGVVRRHPQHAERRGRHVVETVGASLAPLIWAPVYCGMYRDWSYLPMALLIALAMWCLTVQPIWLYLVVSLIPTGSRRGRSAQQ